MTRESLASLRSALATTVAQETARFSSMNRRGGPTGPATRAMSYANEGIVDFTSRGAITRSSPRRGGPIQQLSRREKADYRAYMLFDGTSWSICLFGQWQQPEPTWPAELPRGPIGLSFLDLMRPESLIKATELDPDEVRGEPATHYIMKLDVDRIQWPDPDRRGLAAQTHSRLNRLMIRMAPDPRPKGVLPAHAWVDRSGRLVRFSHSLLPTDHPKQPKALWPTTELWDFGIPPRLQDWQRQPVIDPDTLAFPQSEREAMRRGRT